MPSRALLSNWQTTIHRRDSSVTNMASDDTTRIRAGGRAHLYIEEWFEARGLNDEKVGNRIGRDRATVHRWRKEQHRLNPGKLAELAAALDLEPAELFRPPSSGPSLDVMVKDTDPNDRDMIVDVVRRLANKTG